MYLILTLLIKLITNFPHSKLSTLISFVSLTFMDFLLFDEIIDVKLIWS